jgi:hypothetical protein
VHQKYGVLNMGKDSFDFRRSIPNIQPALPAALEAAKLGYADLMYDRLMKQIGEFEKTLNPDEEIAAHLASFGREYIVQIHDIGYHNPYLIVFKGINVADGSKVRLVQHVTQINVLFVAVKVVEENRKPIRFGFVQNKESPST